MSSPTISNLQAAAGRFLTGGDLFAWEDESRRRCVELIRLFQAKSISGEDVRAALQAERTGPSPASLPAGIAVLSLIGPLTPGESFFTLLGMGTALSGFTRNVYAAKVDPKIKALVVITDSPGGSIRGVVEAAAALRSVREVKPVVAAVTGLDASAAFWITSNATVIEATPSSSLGSVGIVTERVSVVKQLAADGVDVAVLSAGKFKAEGHPATAMSEAERKALQARVDNAYASFVNDIAAGRQVSAASVRSGYGEGRLLDAVDALKAGMINRIATVDDTLARTLASPATFTALYEGRVEQARTSSERLRRDRVHAEIARHRDQLQASVRRVTLR